MFASRKIFHNIFAPASLGFVLASALLSPITVNADAAAATVSVKRQAAQTQFAKAEEQRAALNSKPAEKRALADYKQAVSSYRRVYLITPHATEVPDSLLAVAELYTEMGGRFGRSYYQSAVDSYQFLVHEYPTSRYCPDAMLRAAKLQQDQLGDFALATKTYEDFLKRYRHSSRRREAQEALAELGLLQNGEKAASAKNVLGPASAPAAAEKSAPARVPAASNAGRFATAPDKAERAASSEIPHVKRIRTSGGADSARITIDLEDQVQYTSARIANPDRIFFDLHAARLTPEMAKGNIHVDGNLLTAVRVAQNQGGVVRVVFDVNGVKDYTASLSNHPPQLLIELYANAAPVRAAKPKHKQAQSGPEDEETSAEASSEGAGEASPAMAKKPPVETASASARGAAHAPKALSGSVAANSTPAAAKNSAAGSKSARPKPVNATAGRPALIQPVTLPQPTRDGQATLTRTLGLKIGRIVIDAGHGGHDTGTIGPTGLMEKDLCLDVALRLGKIIQQRLPGADVVYTRSDDTFIPLEERTRLANEAKADLFISIHANSSQDHAARGIETYYLNLKGSAEAMEVAARENAAAQESVHDLQDLVKKIARTEKVDESREFAGDIQDSLARRIQKTSKTVKNRGVRKAPFVVLIGADMPSILTEISFLSNPSDEQLLKKPDYRQRVAEGLYQGVASYLQSLNSVTINLPPRSVASRSLSVAAVEQSRNQQ